MGIEHQLRAEIEKEISYLGGLEGGTDKYRATVDGVTKLVDRVIELKRLDIEADDRALARESDEEFKRKQMKEERKDRILRHGIELAGILIPTAVTIWGTVKSIEFEKEGTITTIMGRGFISKLLPRK